MPLKRLAVRTVGRTSLPIICWFSSDILVLRPLEGSREEGRAGVERDPLRRSSERHGCQRLRSQSLSFCLGRLAHMASLSLSPSPSLSSPYLSLPLFYNVPLSFGGGNRKFEGETTELTLLNSNPMSAIRLPNRSGKISLDRSSFSTLLVAFGRAQKKTSSPSKNFGPQCLSEVRVGAVPQIKVRQTLQRARLVG